MHENSRNLYPEGFRNFARTQQQAQKMGNQMWRATVKDGLQAWFLQPSGPSRPGTDWVVTLTNGKTERRVFVRSYSDEGRDAAPETEARIVLSYINDLFARGWTPDDYKSEPGELVVPADQKIGAATTVGIKPWWRF